MPLASSAAASAWGRMVLTVNAQNLLKDLQNIQQFPLLSSIAELFQDDSFHLTEAHLSRVAAKRLHNIMQKLEQSCKRGLRSGSSLTAVFLQRSQRKRSVQTVIGVFTQLHVNGNNSGIFLFY